MNLTTGEFMMYGGIASFVLLLVIFIIMMIAFKAQRKKMIKRIEKEIDEE